MWTSCRQCLRAIRGAPEDNDQWNPEMHLEAATEGVLRCTGRR
jgi:hypothetical protein